MRTLLFIILLLSVSDGRAQVAAVVGTGRNEPSANRIPSYHNHPATPLLFEDFENPTGYDLAGWAEDIGPGGVVNEDYTATVLYGTQSLFIDEPNDDQAYTTNSFAANDRVWMAFRFRPTNIPDTADTGVIRLTDSANACQFRFTLNSDGEPRVQFGCGGTAFQPSATMAVNTTYTVWIEYWNDNGPNAYLSMAFSTGSVRPTSGSNFVEATGAQTATQVSRVLVGRPGSENGSEIDFIIDHLLIDDVQIESYP
jgi:hypothetical protein